MEAFAGTWRMWRAWEIVGNRDAELDELLAEADAIQALACAAIRPGAAGSDVWASVEGAIRQSRHRPYIRFEAHGIGLVSHEAPMLGVGAAAAPHEILEPGMTICVETAISHPRRGLMKLEDVIAVTEAGHEVYGSADRGWSACG